jgi:hypothetical protein
MDRCLLSVVNNNNQTQEVQSPLQLANIIASLTCFASLLGSYWFEKPLVEMLDDPWAEFLVYATIPISVTFIILYRSCWHPEIIGLARTSSLLLLSCLILVGVILAIGILHCVIWFCSTALTVTHDPG